MGLLNEKQSSALKKSWRWPLALGVVLCGLAINLAFVAYQGLVKNGLRAEAHLMLSYIATLERAYHLEHGKYVAFDEYGAQKGGEGLCVQPQGAKRLGFSINWCLGVSGTDPVRYFYSARVDSEGAFDIKAHSGSDKQGFSFICFGEGEHDVWALRPKAGRVHEKDCEVD